MSIDELHRHRLALIPLRSELMSAREHLNAREAVIALGVEGKNAEERKAKLVVALANDAQAELHRATIDAVEQAIGQHEATIEYLRDQRRDWEWRIRMRLAAALDGQNLPPEEQPDAAFDTVADAAVLDAVSNALDDVFEPKYDPPYQPPPRRNAPVLVTDDDCPF